MGVIGVDEVGRGPLAGPVVGAGVKVEDIDILSDLGITDSKKLTATKRRKILSSLGIEWTKLTPGEVYRRQVSQGIFEFVVVEVGPQDIDRINILQASLLAMTRSAELLGAEGCDVRVDGNHALPTLPSTPIIKGDLKDNAIGLASIVAKEYRDHLMQELGMRYPGYGLESHAGYPTVSHKEAVAKFGPTPIHRKSFKGVREHLN